MIPSSNFDEWKRNNGCLIPSSGSYETSWPQQLALAKQLYDEAYGSHPGFVPDDTSPEDVIKDVQTAEYDAEKIVTWKGISADWLIDVFCQTPFIQRLIEFDCDCWFVRDVCFIELLRRNGRQGALVYHVTMFDDDLCVGPPLKKQRTTPPAKLFRRSSDNAVTEKAGVFVSYTGRYKFRFFVESLQGLRGKPLWTDLFCVDQFAWSGGKGTPTLDKCRNGLLDGLCSSIHEIGSVVLLLERWDGIVDTVGQSWVFWEMFNAVRANASIRFVLSSAERTRLLASVDSFEAEVLSQLIEMDMDELKAANLHDRKAILDRLRDEDISLHDVSCKICDCVRDLFCNEVTSSHAKTFLSNTTSSSFETDGVRLFCSLMADIVLDAVDPSTLNSINDVASCLYSQGKLFAPEPLYQKPLSIRLDEDHRRTLTSATSVAMFLKSQGKLEHAESLLRGALNSCRRSLGDDHKDTLSSMKNLALFLEEQCYLEKANPLFQEVLNSRRRILGNNHRHTLVSINNMASCLENQGKQLEAEALFREAVEHSRRIHGDDHKDTFWYINMLTLCLRHQGKLKEAETLSQDALDNSRRVLGDDHPDTLMFISTMAWVLQDQGELEEADPLYRELVDRSRRIHGDDHPDTFAPISDMAYCLEAQGKLQEAEALYREVLNRSQRILGANHPDTAIYLEDWDRVRVEKRNLP